jgi:hypothetical protein
MTLKNSLVTVEYIKFAEAGTQVCITEFNLYHDLTDEMMTHLIDEFLKAQPPQVTEELFCLFVAIYADIHKLELPCFTKELFEKQYDDKRI